MATRHCLNMEVILNFETYIIVELYNTHTKRDTISVVHTLDCVISQHNRGTTFKHTHHSYTKYLPAKNVSAKILYLQFSSIWIKLV